MSAPLCIQIWYSSVLASLNKAGVQGERDENVESGMMDKAGG